MLVGIKKKCKNSLICALADQESTDKATFPSEGTLCATLKELEVKLYVFISKRALFCMSVLIVQHSKSRSFWKATTVFPMNVILCSDASLVCVLGSPGGSSAVFVSQRFAGENAPQVLPPRGKGHGPLSPGGGAGVGPQH